MLGEITGGGVGSHIGVFWFNFAVWTTARGINGVGSIPGGASPSNWYFYNNSLASYHPGGCHFTLGDGSVTFISQNVDQNLLWSLTTRAGKRSDGWSTPDPILVSGPP